MALEWGAHFGDQYCFLGCVQRDNSFTLIISLGEDMRSVVKKESIFGALILD